MRTSKTIGLITLGICATFIYCQQLQCTSRGRFPIPPSNCTQYMYCGLVGNNFVRSDWTCSGRSLFNARAQKCAVNYICPNSVCQNSTNSGGSGGSGGNQTFVDPNGTGSTFIKCEDFQGSVMPVVYQCPTGQAFNATAFKCE